MSYSFTSRKLKVFCSYLSLTIIILGLCSHAHAQQGLREDTNENLSQSPSHRKVETTKNNRYNLTPTTLELVPSVCASLLGLVPANPECGASFLYGVAGASTLIPNSPLPLILPIIATRTPTHMSRFFNFNKNWEENIIEMKKSHPDNWQAMLGAKIGHALLNYTFPMMYMLYSAEKDFPVFAAATLPFVALSNIAKGMENPERQVQTAFYPVSLGACILKGLVVQQMVESVFPVSKDQNEHNDTARFSCSWGAGAASAMLTYAYDRGKISHFVQRVVQNPTEMVLTTLQAGIITSAYCGFLNSPGMESIPFAIVGSFAAYETILEAVSVDYNLPSLEIMRRAMNGYRRWF